MVGAVAILALALGLRCYHLTSLPYGLHGDEAVSGLEGQRILRNGYIGPYSPSALGQPAGPLYLTAISVALLGNTILAVRIVPALTGTATVLAFYLLLRRSFDPARALLGMALLAIMSWHIHFAHIAFSLETWPLLTSLASLALIEAVRGERRAWWAATGVLAGLGLYVYNAHILFLAVIALFIGLELGWSARARLGRRLRNLGLFGLALALTSLPMLLYAADPRSGYFSHFRETSLTRQPDWLGLAVAARLQLIVGRYLGFWDAVCCHPRVDGADGSGATPLVPLAMLLLAAAGAVLTVARRRRPLVLLGLLVVLLMPFGAALTEGGLARRPFALAPFLAMFAALGAIELFELARAQDVGTGRLTAVCLTAVVGLVVGQNLHNYFVGFAGSEAERWTFAHEMTEAAEFMRVLPRGSYVYFAATRWSVDYETRRFLAPSLRAEDRSAEFGRRTDLDVDPARGSPVFILLGGYRSRIVELRRRYPGGSLAVGGRPGDPSFLAYRPP